MIARLRPGTVRSRVTIAAGLALTAAVTLGLVVMYLLQADSARRTVQSQVRTYATQIEQSAAVDGAFPDPLPRSGLDPAAEAQVLSADGRVLAATRTLAGLPAVYALPPDSDTPVRQKAAEGVVPGEVTVYGVHVTVGGRPATIITGTPTTLLSQVNETFARLLLIGLPALLLLACGTVWIVVGRALRPVEEIRGAVTAITDLGDLTSSTGPTSPAGSPEAPEAPGAGAGRIRRVPQPGTDDEIGRLAETMNAMLARLEDSAARQRRFVADASHELRSPLTAIRTSLEVGLAHPEQAPWPALAERSVRQAARLENLIGELLLLARSDAGKTAARRQHVPLAPLLGEVTTTLVPSRPGAPGAPGVVELDVPPDLAVIGNPADLARLFRNLVENAARHGRSIVRVSATEAGQSVRVEIADDGPGIPVEERQRVFDRFVRLDAGRGHADRSTGLGLAIVKEIVTGQGGTVVIGEAAEGGASVIVTLPSSAGRPTPGS